MNDTEEMRRLFAVATEDLPPGIDLLRGVRTRTHRKRTRTRIALSAGAAGIVAAATAITLSVVQAPSALAQVTQAAARTAEQSYRVSSVSTVLVSVGPATSKLTIHGEFDRPAKLGEETASDGSQVRYVGRYMYVSVTEAMRKAHEKAGTPIPAGKTWLRLPAPPDIDVPALDLIVIGGSTNGLGQVDPQNLLALLRNSSQVSEQGPVSGPDWTGTAYTFAARLTTRGPLHITLSSTGTVDVDRQGRIRQLDATQALGQNRRTVRVTFGDFGLAVSVSPPPASETFTPPAGNLAPNPTLSPAPAGSG
ncbi:MAG: hypothetical protein ABSB59_41230 [Streptosporangiaceae bacterium]